MRHHPESPGSGWLVVAVFSLFGFLLEHIKIVAERGRTHHGAHGEHGESTEMHQGAGSSLSLPSEVRDATGRALS